MSQLEEDVVCLHFLRKCHPDKPNVFARQSRHQTKSVFGSICLPIALHLLRTPFEIKTILSINWLRNADDISTCSAFTHDHTYSPCFRWAAGSMGFESLKGLGQLAVNKSVISITYIVASKRPLCSAQILVVGWNPHKIKLLPKIHQYLCNRTTYEFFNCFSIKLKS